AVGAFSSLPLTYLGGIGLGLAASLTTKVIGQMKVTGPIQSLPANMPFIVLFVALLVIPTRKLVERGNQVVRRPLPPVVLSRRGPLAAGRPPRRAGGHAHRSAAGHPGHPALRYLPGHRHLRVRAGDPAALLLLDVDVRRAVRHPVAAAPSRGAPHPHRHRLLP